MKWADECAGMHARKSTGYLCVTRYIDRINFVSTARIGTIVKITTTIAKLGNSSITFSIVAKDDITDNEIASIEKIVFVCVDGNHRPIKHGLGFSDG